MDMKKIIYLFLIFTVSQYKVHSQNQDVFGKWINSEIGSNISAIQFNSNDTAILFQGENTSPSFTYIVDKSKTPYWIDMVAEKDGIEARIFGLLEFINSDSIKIEMFNSIFDGHPDKFSIIPSRMSQLYFFNRVK